MSGLKVNTELMLFLLLSYGVRFQTNILLWDFSFDKYLTEIHFVLKLEDTLYNARTKKITGFNRYLE